MVPASQLAQLLETEEKTIRKLSRLGYLKRGKGGLIELPSLPALKWLKLMLRPLPLRPLFTLLEVAQLSGLPTPKLREIILAWNIPLYFDPALGELLAPDSLIHLINAIHSLREPLRLDHQALLAWMQGMGSKGNHIQKLLPYSKLIEQEIRRIYDLAEPERTQQAYKFWKRFRVAKVVSHCIDQKTRKKNVRRDAKIEELDREARHVLDQSTVGHGEADRRKRKRASLRASLPTRHPAPPRSQPERDLLQSPDIEHVSELPTPPLPGEE